MGEELKNATNLSINNANYLYSNYPKIKFKFGFIYYSDPIDVSTDRHGYLQLTKDFAEIKKFCDTWEMQGGGDLAEDWVGAYDIALNKIKWGEGRKFIIHICDAPAHGKLFSKDYDDNHKEQKYENDLKKNIIKCAKRKIEIIGVYNVLAKECFIECKKIYDENNGKTFIIQKYDPNNILSLIPNFIFDN